jgi:hypothetical protein
MTKTLNYLTWPAMNRWTMRHVVVAADERGVPS